MRELTERIIGAAIEVHRYLGPGLLESLYEKALCHELERREIKFSSQVSVPVVYKNIVLGEHRLDLLVEDTVIVELKAVERIDPVFNAQLLSYLRLTQKKLGLLINFNVPLLRDGISRIIL